MGRLSEWAEKNKAGSAKQLAKKAERAQTREDLKADFAATRAGLADTKAEMAVANVKLKEGFAATKGKWDEDREVLGAERAAIGVELADAKAGHAQVKETDQAERAAARRDAHLAKLDVKAAKGESFEGVELKLGQVRYKGQGGSVLGAVARVESAADVRQRVTATRVLAIGVFALVAKKAAGHVYLTVEAPGFEFVAEIPVKKEADARSFAAKINDAAKRAG